VAAADKGLANPDFLAWWRVGASGYIDDKICVTAHETTPEMSWACRKCKRRQTIRFQPRVHAVTLTTHPCRGATRRLTKTAPSHARKTA
jgi:hypothetical protein